MLRWLFQNGGVLGLCVLTQITTSRRLGDDTLHGERQRPRGRESRAEKDTSTDAADDALASEAILGTLVQTHTGERVLVSRTEPTGKRFDSLLRDRAMASETTMDPRLLELLRSLLRNHPGARIELVSGYRSEKLNEMMRKKGHHVASHSQHSLGHAVDFRLVLEGASKGENPKDVERELRAMGWEGGIGTYFGAHDWFVHADVGKNRRWNG